MKNIYEVLQELDIKYVKHDHPAFFTCEDADKYHIDINGAHVKNLFLRNRSGNTHYLVVIPSEKKVDINYLRKQLEESKLGFASPERLMKHLGLTPGSVSIFGLINNEDKKVKVIIDEDLWKEEIICPHPNINTSTLEVKRDDLQKFLDWSGNDVRFMSL